MTTEISSAKQALVLERAHQRLDRALARFVAKHGVQWESRVIIGAAVECGEGGHEDGECVPYCKDVAAAWENVEYQQAIKDDALLTEALAKEGRA